MKLTYYLHGLANLPLQIAKRFGLNPVYLQPSQSLKGNLLIANLLLLSLGFSAFGQTENSKKLTDSSTSLKETGIELGYQKISARQTSVSSDAIYSNEILKSPVVSFKNALSGRIAGLYSLQSSGLPGGDGANLTLRGQEPIILIDGVVANLTVFDLEEIESITVLKDAVATSMLGVRGAHGAILVTTKKGQK